MALSLAEAELIGTLLEAMCYGMFLMLFLELLRVLYVRHRAGRSIKLLLVIALLIFSLITTDVVLQTNQVVEAFTDHMDVANAPVTYSITLSGHARMAKACIFMMLTLVCDALMVYRAFVVCESKYRTIALPSVLFLADIVLFAWFLWSYLNIDKHQTSLRTALIRIDYFYAVTLTLNLLCTVLISWKIWASHRKLSGSAAAGVRIMGVITIIIESAGVYSCILAALILTNALNTTVLCVILDPTYPVIGIIFSAVMVRASREYHGDTFMNGDLTLPTHAQTERTSHQQTFTTGQRDDDPASNQAFVPERKRSTLDKNSPVFGGEVV